MVAIIMPVRNQVEITASIINQLLDQDDWERCWIFDNGSTDATPHLLSTLDDRFTPVQAGGRLIYDMWDIGFRVARTSGFETVAIINNDLHLSPGTFTRMDQAFAQDQGTALVYPDYDLEVSRGAWDAGLRYTSGTYRHGGMSGFCFALRTAAVDWSPLVDQRFLWWGGDDDIAFNLEARGWSQARLEGLPVDHLHEGTARHHDLGEVKAADMARIIEKWGR